MPWLELAPSGHYHVVFRFAGRKCKRTLKTRSELKAKSACTRLDENHRLLERGLIDVPKGADLVQYLLTDGKSHGKKRLPPSLPLGPFFEEYLQSIPPDSLEEQTIYVAKIHIGHFQKCLGKLFPLHRLSEEDLQHYVVKRGQVKGRHGRLISTVTIKKELATLPTLWNWARHRGYLKESFPSHNLRFPKTSDKPGFQTRQQIERQLAVGGLTKGEEEQLWAALFLTVPDTEELLEFIEEHSAYGFLYPMAVMAAHTGARRSELCRSWPARGRYRARSRYGPGFWRGSRYRNCRARSQ